MNPRSLPSLAASFGQCRDPLHFRDTAGRVIRANSAATDFFGWPDAPFDPGDHEVVAHALDVASRLGSWRGELKRLDAGGNHRLLESHWSVISDEAGDAPTAFFVQEFDVTERRQLDFDRLRAQRMESIGTLAGGIAHDLNNVLGPILMAAEMIKQRVSDDWIITKLDGIEEGARRGADIVRTVLDIARGVEGERIPVQVRHVVKELVDFVRRTFSRAIEISVDLPKDLPHVLADAGLIRQLLLTLMLNARDAMPEGGTLSINAGSVQLAESEAIALSPDGTAGDFVQIEVGDTGDGIAPEVMERMFEPFFTTRSRSQGRGLGLSTALTIVRSHRGFISIDSELGHGARFSVFLPIRPAHISDDGARVLPAVAAEQEARTLLVVDDEPLMLEMNLEMLKAEGFTVITAQDGQEGLTAFLRSPDTVDLVVTDVNMPKMNGAEMLREMRKVRPQLPAVVVSGLPEHRHVVEGRGLADVVLLGKPYTIQQLSRAISGLLERTSRNSHGRVVSDDAFDDLIENDEW